MKFSKIEILDARLEYNIYYGFINSLPAVLFADKNIPDTFNITGEIILKNENAYKFNQQGVYILYYPVDENYVNSYKGKIKIITETYDDYKSKVEPYINSILVQNTKWINNILHDNAESSRVLFKNDKFVITKNICWDNKLSDFYILVIPYEPIKNIRHLDTSHKSLLEEMKYISIEIAKDYQIDENELYFFFHYHPSCYHLHLHVCLINNKTLKCRLYRHILLDDLIENIEKYQKSSIKFEINISNPIYKLLC